MEKEHHRVFGAYHGKSNVLLMAFFYLFQFAHSDAFFSAASYKYIAILRFNPWYHCIGLR